MYAFTTSITV